MEEILNSFVNTGLDDTLAKSFAYKSGLIQVVTTVHGKTGKFLRMQWVKPAEVAQIMSNNSNPVVDSQGKPIKPLYFPFSNSGNFSVKPLSLKEVVSQYTKDRSNDPIQKYIHDNYFVSDGQSQTKEAYCKSEGYIKQRRQLHQRIINDLLAEAGSPKNGEKPVCILLGGGTASGKSTIRNAYIEPDLKENDIKVATVDSDEIKKDIPEYEYFKKQDTESAAFRVHQESADITSEALNALMKNKKNFIYDGTMKSLSKYGKIIDSLKNSGYEIRIVAADVPVSIAIERSNRRADRTGRKVPEGILRSSHGGCAYTFPKIAEKADSFKLYDNTGEAPVLMRDNQGIHDETLYNAFVKKGEDYYTNQARKRA